MVTDKFPKGHPMVAPVAIQQGEFIAKNILAKINGKEVGVVFLLPFAAGLNITEFNLTLQDLKYW